MLADREFESDLIGSIYDCALNPSAWSGTLERLCAALNGHSAGIVLLDYHGTNDRLVRDWGPTTVWGDRIVEVIGSIKRIHRQFLGLDASRSQDLILLPRDLAPQVDVFTTPFYEYWARPQGIHQVLEAVALSEPTRLGLFCVTRRVERGDFSADEMGLLRRLAPHIRRAITISDLLDLRAVERNAFKQVMDSLSAGVCIVGSEGRVLHANPAAMEILRKTSHIRIDNDQIRGSGAGGASELMSAVETARTKGSEIGTSGIGIPLTDADGGRAMAHVLPLGCGSEKTRLVPDALAGIFINAEAPASFADVAEVGRSFEFTPAETRLVGQLMTGSALGDCARQLDISEATARTHLKHVFEKCGVSRQVELLTLLQRLMPIARVAA